MAAGGRRGARMNPRDPWEVWTADEAGCWLQMTGTSVRRLVREGMLTVWRHTAFGKRLFRPRDVVELGQRLLEQRLNGQRRMPRARPQLRLPYWGPDRTLTRPALRKPLPWPRRPAMLKAPLRAKTVGS